MGSKTKRKQRLGRSPQGQAEILKENQSTIDPRRDYIRKAKSSSDRNGSKERRDGAGDDDDIAAGRISGLIAHGLNTYNVGDRLLHPPGEARNEQFRSHLFHPGICDVPSLDNGPTESLTEVSTEAQLEHETHPWFSDENNELDPDRTSDNILTGLTGSFFENNYPDLDDVQSPPQCIDPKVLGALYERVSEIEYRANIGEANIASTAPEYVETNHENRSNSSSEPSRDCAATVIACDWEGCDKTFPTPTKLKHHKRYHILPFECTVGACQRKFADKRDLMRHTETHAQRPRRLYLCPEQTCPYNVKGMSRIDNMRRHVAAKHSKR